MPMKNKRDDQPSNPSGSTLVRTTHSMIPMALLDAESRRRFVEEGAALPESAVRRAPSYMTERIRWAKGVAGAASGDREALVKVPLRDGALTAEEIEELGARVEHLNVAFLRWCDARATGTAATAGSEAALRLDALRISQRALQRKLLRAFTVRFKGDAAGRRLLRDIRKGAGDAALLDANVRLLRLCNDPAHREWLASMPKGEAADARALAAQHAEFAALVASDAHDPGGIKDLLDRAWTLTAARLERVLTAGRYHVADNPAREGDYGGFRAPKARKPRAKKPAPDPA